MNREFKKLKRKLSEYVLRDDIPTWFAFIIIFNPNYYSHILNNSSNMNESVICQESNVLLYQKVSVSMSYLCLPPPATYIVQHSTNHTIPQSQCTKHRWQQLQADKNLLCSYSKYLNRRNTYLLKYICTIVTIILSA